MKKLFPWLFFIVCLLPLAVAYYPLKNALPPWLFVTMAIAYLVVIKLAMDFIVRKVNKNGEEEQ